MFTTVSTKYCEEQCVGMFTKVNFERQYMILNDLETLAYLDQ